MYFASRVQAGRMLATRLKEKYRYENCAVLALSDGGVMVGAQIAKELHCVLTLLMSSEINLPQEPKPIAAISSSGEVVYNQSYSEGDLAELVSENRSFIEAEKIKHMHHLNQLVGGGGTIRKDLLRGHYVILVSDGLKSGFELDLAYQFLKPIKSEGLVVATPLASVAAVDRMHVLADDLYCLNVVAEFADVDHYYDKKDVPDHATVLETLENIILKWQ